MLKRTNQSITQTSLFCQLEQHFRQSLSKLFNLQNSQHFRFDAWVRFPRLSTQLRNVVAYLYYTLRQTIEVQFSAFILSYPKINSEIFFKYILKQLTSELSRITAAVMLSW